MSQRLREARGDARSLQQYRRAGNGANVRRGRDGAERDRAAAAPRAAPLPRSPDPRCRDRAGSRVTGPRAPLTPGDVLALQRTVGNRAAIGVVQRKAYEVSRELPLETHFRLIAPDEATKLLLGKLRSAFPLDPETQSRADANQWTQEQRDAARGEDFSAQKRRVTARTTNPPAHYGPRQDTAMVWAPSAHVSGLSVVNERERRQSPESKQVKDVTGEGDWIGAHLVKREWGGEDNMWNVVCWPKAAEARWGREFEEPIEIAFANQTRRKLDISISVTKEDDAVTANAVAGPLATALASVPEQQPRWRRHVESEAARLRARANSAIERIPTSAEGVSKLGRCALRAEDTCHPQAVDRALAQIETALQKLTKQPPHEKKPVKSPEEVEEQQRKERKDELARDWAQEVRNYRPERYKAVNDLLD